MDSRAMVCGVKIKEGSLDPHVAAMNCWILVCQLLIEHSGGVNFGGKGGNNSVLFVCRNWGKGKQMR